MQAIERLRSFGLSRGSPHFIHSSSLVQPAQCYNHSHNGVLHGQLMSIS